MRRCLPYFFIFERRCLTIRNNTNTKEHYINDEIKTVLGFAPTKILRVIGPDGEQLGMLTFAAAQNKAYDKGLDLVMISAQADPPVCKIIDYGNFRYERDKREKEAKKKQQVMDIKEIKLSCQIDTNDFMTKVNHARRFLTGGDKVKVIVKFKGREMSHLDVGRGLLQRFREACEDLGGVDKAPNLEGRFMSMFITPNSKREGASGKSARSGQKGDKKTSAPEGVPSKNSDEIKSK